MIMEALMYGWMERAKIVALANAPPLITFNMPKMVFCIVSK